MFKPRQEAAFGRAYEATRMNMPEDPLLPGDANVHLPLSQPFPCYPAQTLPLPPPHDANVHLPLHSQPFPCYPAQTFPPPPHDGGSSSQSPLLLVATPLPQQAKSSKFYQTFLKGKPKALGIVVIVTAALQIVLGITLITIKRSVFVLTGVPFIGPVIYIIAGSLTIAAQTKPNICLIIGSLSLNIITSLAVGIGLFLSIADIFMVSNFGCYSNVYVDGNFQNASDPTCQSIVERFLAVISILLITNLLLFCVSISISVFGCKSLSQVSEGPQEFVIQNDTVSPIPPSAPPATGFIQPSPYASRP